MAIVGMTLAIRLRRYLPGPLTLVGVAGPFVVALLATYLTFGAETWGELPHGGDGRTEIPSALAWGEAGPTLLVGGADGSVMRLDRSAHLIARSERHGPGAVVGLREMRRPEDSQGDCSDLAVFSRTSASGVEFVAHTLSSTPLDQSVLVDIPKGASIVCEELRSDAPLMAVDGAGFGYIETETANRDELYIRGPARNPLRVVPSASRKITALAALKDGAAVGLDDGSVVLVDHEGRARSLGAGGGSGSGKSDGPSGQSPAASDPVDRIAVASNSSLAAPRVAWATRSGRVRIDGVDVPDLELQRTARTLLMLAGHDGAVDDASFSPDGKRIVTASGETARIWNAASPKAAFEGLASLSFSADGTRLLARRSEGALVLIGIGKSRGIVKQAAKAEQAVVSDQASTLDIRSASLTGGLSVVDAALSPDGGTVYVAASDGSIHVLDVADVFDHPEQTREVANFVGHADVPAALALSPTGDALALADVSGRISITDLNRARLIAYLESPFRRAADTLFQYRVSP